MELTWHVRTFAELTVAELYAIMQLRQRVFVVEQNCPYLDADDVDQVSRHVWAERSGQEAGPLGSMTRGRGAALAAYLRIVPAGVKFAELSIGRVITAPDARGTGLGRELMKRGIAAAGNVPIRIGAQAHLEKFYGELGFARASNIYDEDGIPHIEMTRAATTASL